MRTIEIRIGEGTRYEICLTALGCGGDLSVTICGGTRHHVGATALACGCLPDGSPLKYSATVSTIVALDHKDDTIARAAAKKLADYIHGNVSVTAGIHIDNAKPEELQLLQENCEKAYEELQKRIKADPER